ncbi:N-acetyltransferase family protein [Dongia sp.]|uniref:GNAT family N-acetyltransferase n=1 Tax=Dongia sp. TaxID=1977262 RepID=UPI0035AD8D13
MTSIRVLTAADVDAVQKMVLEFGAYLQELGDSWTHNFTTERYLVDGFGANPAFHGLIAEDDGAALGYLLMSPNYDVDRGIRIEIVIDLWVNEQARGRGVGKALMAEAAELARRRGARQLLWAVYKPNKLAADFYRSIGGQLVGDLDWMYLPLD